MNYVEEQTTIRKFFLNGWDSTRTPVMFAGEPGLTSGTRALKDEKGLKEWVRVAINPTGGSQRDMAGPESRVRYQGIVSINVFVLATTGASKRAREILDTINSKFIFQTQEALTFLPPQNGLTAETEGLLQMTLNIPYFWYNI